MGPTGRTKNRATNSSGLGHLLNLLIVEDSPADAKLMVAALKSAGYAVSADVVDTLSGFQDRLRKNDYDVVLSDHNFGSWTGMDALEMLQTSGKAIPFIAVTASLGDEGAVQYIKRGASDYVLKRRLNLLPLAVSHSLSEQAHRDEMAHVQAEKALLFAAVEQSSESVVITDKDGRIEYANPAFTRITGYSREEALGQRPSMLKSGLHSEEFYRSFWQTILAGKLWEGEVTNRKKDGTFYTEHMSITPVRDQRGEVCNFIAVKRDITERKQIEEQLRLSDEILRHVGAIVLVLDSTGQITYANPFVKTVLGYEPEELLGDGWWKKSRIEDADAVREKDHVDAALHEAIAISSNPYERRVFHRDGTERMILWRDTRLGDQLIGVGHDITNLKLAENAFRESEEKFRALLDSTAEAIYGLDLNGNCTFCNPASVHMLGHSAQEELLGKNMHDAIHHSRRDGTPYPVEECPIFKAFTDGQPYHVDDEVLWRADRTHFPAEYWSYPVRKEGRIVGSVVTFLDITERKRAEQRLQASEEKYRILFERNPQPMWVYDAASLRFLAVNQAAIDHYGYSRSEFLSMTLKDIRPIEEAPAMLQSAFGPRGDVARAGVRKHRTKDGRTIFVEVTDCRIEFEGQPASLVLANDVTEKKHAEEELHESEEKYRQLIENASYGIFRSTLDGRLLGVNPAFVAMLGYTSREEVLQLNLETDVYHDANERKDIQRSYGSDARRVAAEVVFKRKDGGLIKTKTNGRLIPAHDGRPQCFEVMAEDVTQQRSLEDQFRQAQKMEAVGRLAGGIAHDFNNVLMIVNSYVELIMRHLSPDSAIQSYAEHIVQAVKKAASLTNQLLAFSRKQMLQPTVLDLHAVVSDIGKMLPPMLGEDIEMTIVAEPGLGSVFADRAQIEQVLMNLAVNARDAMPNGGKLQIDLRNATVDRQYMQRHPQIVPGSYVVLAISDTGIGIDSATQTKIFEPFFTTKEVGKGTGLGLSTVYGIVKQTGGFVWVYSEPGLGTTFKIYLPRVYGNAIATSEPTSEDKREYSGDNETVLLVDDEPEVRCATREFLEGKGYRILEAENGAGALAVCTAYQGSIQVLVTDLIMPSMRGPELASKVSELHPEISTVYMSGYTDRSQDIEGLGPDAVFLQKPFSLNTLVQKIQTVLQRKRGEQSD
jgi:two-component system, cell cycle sensor histidine kinase and response regulator CckA